MKTILGPLSDVNRAKVQILAEIDEAISQGHCVQVSIDAPKQTRSLAQNNMQFQWYLDAEKQSDMTAREWRAYCKLHIGVPILRMEDEEFREVYDKVIRPLEYEQKLALMIEPIDLPVTSRMTVKQKSQFLDDVHALMTGKDIQLTEPEERAA